MSRTLVSVLLFENGMRIVSMGLIAFAVIVVGGCTGGGGDVSQAPPEAHTPPAKNQQPTEEPESEISKTPSSQDETLISSCPSPTATPPTEIAPLPTTTVVGAEWTSNAPIDLSACDAKRLHAWLGQGSAWIRLEPAADDDVCRVWLGGETENPEYNGAASQYCEFARACPQGGQNNILTIPLGDGGPARISHPACTGN